MASPKVRLEVQPLAVQHRGSQALAQSAACPKLRNLYLWDVLSHPESTLTSHSFEEQGWTLS